MAVYILHIYIHITVQSCIHKARHTVLYGKCKSISEVIRTICDFPPPGFRKETQLEIVKLEVCEAKVWSQTCSKGSGKQSNSKIVLGSPCFSLRQQSYLQNQSRNSQIKFCPQLVSASFSPPVKGTSLTCQCGAVAP